VARLRPELKLGVAFAYLGHPFPDLRSSLEHVSILRPQHSLGLFAAFLGVVFVFSGPDHNLPREANAPRPK
jgi:hypothetical protein